MPVRGYYGGRLRRRYQAEIVTTRLMWRRFQLGNVGLPRNTAPTLIQYAESSWTTTTASKATTTSITWLTGDVIVVVGGTGDQGNVITSVTATGLTFTPGTPLTAASSCWANTWTVTASSGGTSAVTANISVTGVPYGIAVWVYRGSDGIGGRGADTSTGKTVSLGRVDDHSAVVCGIFDWSAGTTTSHVWTPTGQTEDEAQQVGTQYTAFVADWGDQGTSATIAYGISGTASVGAHSKVALEILGTISAGSNVNVNDTNPDITHTTGDVTSTQTTTDGGNPLHTHVTGDPSYGIGVGDTNPSTSHTTQDVTSAQTTTDGTAPALTHTTGDPAPSGGANAVDAVTAHTSYDATVSTTSLVNANAELTQHTVVAGDPSTTIAITAELTNHAQVTGDALAGVGASAGAGATSHTTGDALAGVSAPDGTAPADAHTTGAPTPGIGVNAVDAANTHTSYDATVSTAVILNVNAPAADNQHITGTPAVEIDTPAGAPATTHQTFDAVASTSASVTDLAAPANAHTTSPAAAGVGGQPSVALHSFITSDVANAMGGPVGAPSIGHSAFDAIVLTHLSPPAFVGVEGGTTGGGFDSGQARGTTRDASTLGSTADTDSGRVTSVDVLSSATGIVS
jgi:hypothetical protein